MSFAVIANPTAGRGRGSTTARRIEELLRESKEDFHLQLTKKPKEAIELARRASGKHERVIAIGGDGTIREVLQGVYEGKSTLGIIPSGTGNDYARGLGIPFDTKEALDVILQGYLQPMDLGVDQDNFFGVLNSVGFPVSVMENVNYTKNKKTRGPLAFLMGIYQALKDLTSYPMEVTVDGKSYEYDAAAAIVMNMPYGGGGLKFAPEENAKSGHLSLVMIGEVTKRELLVTLPKTYWGGHVKHRKVHVYQGTSIKVTPATSLKQMLDGDIERKNSISARIMPAALQVLVPKHGSLPKK